MSKKKLVILTGAGMSAESGISTFRDSGGLWEKYDVQDVASIDGWHRNPALVQEFYNARRKQLITTSPNDGHKGLVALEELFDVQIITQNVDNLHERAGSSHVLHLHGELMKVRSTRNESRIYTLSPDNCEISMDTRDEYGDTLRPHIVFFGEAVPMFDKARDICCYRHIAQCISGCRTIALRAPRHAHLPHRSQACKGTRWYKHSLHHTRSFGRSCPTHNATERNTIAYKLLHS